LPYFVAASAGLADLLARADAARGLAAATRLAVALLALTRPLFVYVAPLFAAVLLLPLAAAPPRAALRAVRTLAYLAPVVVLLGGWSAWNGRMQGTWGLSTMAGFNLTQHAGPIMQDAPDSEAVLRDIYLDHRARMRREYGTHVHTIWAAVPDMQRATGQSYAELSRRMGRISAALLISHPREYLAAIGPSWVAFWKRVSYWSPERLGPLRPALEALWKVQRLCGVAVNALFLVYCAWLAARAAARRPIDPLHAALATTVLAGSVFQAMVEAGNGRYAVPFLPVIQLLVILGAASILRELRPRPRSAA